MKALTPLLKPAVAALCTVLVVFSTTMTMAPAVAQDVAAPQPTTADLLAQLADPENQTWRRTEREILREWSKSGSAAMDLLLQRGREAMRAGEHAVAIEHLTALTDHAPEFAEGWNARATAYFNVGLYGPALEDIARTLTLNPNHFGALSGLGMIFMEIEDKPRALAAFKSALTIHPHLEGISQRVTRLEAELDGQEI